MQKDFKAAKRGLHRIFALTVVLSLLALGVACSKNANTTNTAGANTSGGPGSRPTGTTTSGSTSSAQSPTEVFRAYYDAAVKRDFATAKGYLSQGTLSLMEEGAKRQNKTVDDMLKESPAVQGDMPQLGNEKVSGDTATVDMTSEGQTVTMPFVKENGGWKIAMDKFIKDMMGGLQGGDPAKKGEAEDDEHSGGH